MSQILVTVPAAMAEFLRTGSAPLPAWTERLASRDGNPPFVSSDPAGLKLGSGGGTVNLLWEAFRASGIKSLGEWLKRDQKLVLHAGGESRRLPAYASIGKAFMPLPAVDGLHPRLANQILADFQLGAFDQTLVEAGQKPAVLVTSGDVWLDFDPTEVPVIEADISGIGMQVSPEVAQHFGVFFVRKNLRAAAGSERSIAFFLQKPKPSEIRKYLSEYDFFVDTGMWLLSANAVEFLFRRCGWNEKKRAFATDNGFPAYLDLYTEVGIALGTETKPSDALRALRFADLRSSVIPLGEARFYHLGSSRQLLESMEQIQRASLTPERTFRIASSGPFKAAERTLNWIEGSLAQQPVTLEGNNVVTGLPSEAKLGGLAPERCLDVVPVGADSFVVRPYHIDDSMRGAGKDGRICQLPADTWLARRGFTGVSGDVFTLPIYPQVKGAQITQALVDWFFAEQPDRAMSEWVREKTRVAARDIANAVNFPRYFAQRRQGYIEGIKAGLSRCIHESETFVFEQDFASIAAFCRGEAPELTRWLRAEREPILRGAMRAEHQARFLMLLSELAEGKQRETLRHEGFSRLQAAMVSPQQLAKSAPRPTLKEDQIVWGRSPVRLDLAGGWTDTPPYCLESGGAVLNVAVLLNGQPPIQIFIRPTKETFIRLRSIDLGSSEDVTTYEELAEFRNPGGHFSLPKAALAFAGFLPEFYAGKPFSSLKAQLKAFGGGLELSLLSAVPKGSGLGTSSILGATLLGAINRACGLGWDDVDLYNRVLGVEQLLTTGGGWQDQAGALFPSLKMVQTQPGPSQVPIVRYLPEQLFNAATVNQVYLLYYTGATRMAKGILQEIVRDMFLRKAKTLRTLGTIRANVRKLYHALQKGDAETFNRSIARSWQLNRQLDRGTTTPEIESIIAKCGDDLAACKLLGAGGGGYMLICAKDPAAGQRLRERLEANPPNPRARFIDFSVSSTGLQVTVS